MASPQSHIDVMESLRLFYRNPFVETILLAAVLSQVISGISLFRLNRKKSAGSIFERVHLWSGLYLAFFLVIHVGAVFSGRLLLHVDTNLYFGAAGLNSFPHLLFFVPYYSLAIVSFFAHLASVHNKKMKRDLFGLQPSTQSIIVVLLGVGLAFLILYGMTNGFKGIEIPTEYKLM
ncbi:MAG: hypothetical protein ACKOE6_01695 [Flammeovirgaceae bacterium]